MFARHNFNVCCPCFEKSDTIEKRTDPTSSPEQYVRDVMQAAGVSGVPVACENFCEKMDDDAYKHPSHMFVTKICMSQREGS